MKEKKIIVGIDVSKLTLDICVLDGGSSVSSVIKNTKGSVRTFIRKLKKEHGKARILIGMENTGLYNWNFYSAVEDAEVQIFVGSSII